MSHASYRFGVEWIAQNDDYCETDATVISQQLTVLLLADLFNKDEIVVANDVRRKREAIRKEKETRANSLIRGE